MPKVRVNIHEIFSSLCSSRVSEVIGGDDLKKVQEHLGRHDLIRWGQYPELMMVHDTDLKETYLYFVDVSSGDIVSDLVRFDSRGEAKVAPAKVTEEFLRPLLNEHD